MTFDRIQCDRKHDPLLFLFPSLLHSSPSLDRVYLFPSLLQKPPSFTHNPIKNTILLMRLSSSFLLSSCSPAHRLNPLLFSKRRRCPIKFSHFRFNLLTKPRFFTGDSIVTNRKVLIFLNFKLWILNWDYKVWNLGLCEVSKFDFVCNRKWVFVFVN